MGSPLNIRNPRAHQLAVELATSRGTSLSDAVIAALEAELRRERERIPLRDRLHALSERLLAETGPPGPDLTEAERDAMWTR